MGKLKLVLGIIWGVFYTWMLVKIYTKEDK